MQSGSLDVRVDEVRDVATVHDFWNLGSHFRFGAGQIPNSGNLINFKFPDLFCIGNLYETL